MLDDFSQDPESHGGPPDAMLLYRLRDLCLRELGFDDIYTQAKDESTRAALLVLPSVLAAIDDISDDVSRSEALIRGMLAGNLAALDSTDDRDWSADFLTLSDSLPPKPWVVDDTEGAAQAWSNGGEDKWSKAVIFCAGAGSETVLGMLPAVRDLAKRNVQVILVAPDMPSGAAITHEDLMNLLHQVQAAAPDDALSIAISSSRILVLNSGSDLQAIDLSAVSPELAYAASDADAIMLHGQSHGWETNFGARFKCPSLRVAVVQQQAAGDLGERHSSCVVKYTIAV
ncbi:hypothetical protein CLOP_g4106 [Closterium sp. NIES-67]|nr:hypothetical protein CLOP_g4106 [Closterium sp. NIES-67]